MIEDKDVTIIIPHLGTTEEQRYSLQQCIDSLIETCSCQIILAINGTKDRAVMVYRPVPDRIQVIQIEDQGQFEAVNAAAAIVNTPWILVSNDDMVYPPGWFERLTDLGAFQKFSIFMDERKLCISPQLVEPRSGAPTFNVYFCGGAGGDFDKQKWLDYVKDEPIGTIRTGFNLPFLISKELWNLVGGYDINYDPWSSNSDSDLEYKIKLSGIQPYQTTRCQIYHFSQTSGTFEPKNRAAWEKNWSYFIEKWGFPRTDTGIWEATFEIPTVEQGRKFKPFWEGFYDKS